MLVSINTVLWISAVVLTLTESQQITNFIPGQGQNFLPQQTVNFIPAQSNRCKNPTTVVNCYVQYLAKYNIRPVNGFLPPFVLLERYVKTQIDLINACRDFDELQQCLGVIATTCINVPVFSIYTQRINILHEAVFYTQNHAFFEFVCGAGKPIFLANSDCLGRAFAGASLTKRMHRCSQGNDLSNNCPAAVTMTTCVKANMEMECGVPAGVASCGAATNIIRREGEVDAGCLFQMDQMCSSARRTTTLILLLALIAYYFQKL